MEDLYCLLSFLFNFVHDNESVLLIRCKCKLLNMSVDLCFEGVTMGIGVCCHWLFFSAYIIN